MNYNQADFLQYLVTFNEKVVHAYGLYVSQYISNITLWY